ncbi:MAG TPA: hypothetical protein VK205_04365 [Prolixibacteraceae bacterium]|nr:hypothetical protein [Prolixibacteraceae bacterium]
MMTTNLLSLTSISQWGLFLGIVFIIYGWLESKDKFILAGQLTFVAISLLALWIVLTHQIEVTVSANGVLTKETKVLGFFKGYLWFSILNIVTLLMKIFKLRYQKIVLAGLILYALLLFFMLYSVMQTPA